MTTSTSNRHASNSDDTMLEAGHNYAISASAALYYPSLIGNCWDDENCCRRETRMRVRADPLGPAPLSNRQTGNPPPRWPLRMHPVETTTLSVETIKRDIPVRK